MSLALIRALTVALEMPVDGLGVGVGDTVAFAVGARIADPAKTPHSRTVATVARTARVFSMHPSIQRRQNCAQNGHKMPSGWTVLFLSVLTGRYSDALLIAPWLKD